MTRYAYQIQGALENAQGSFLGFRVLVCDVNYFETVDVPAEVLDHETVKYMEYRLKLSDTTLDIKRLPIKVQNDIRAPLGRWLDHWVLQHFYGHNSNNQSTNS